MEHPECVLSHILCFGATLSQKQHKNSFFLWNFLIKDQTCKVFIKDGISGDCKSYRSILITLVVNKLVFGSENDTKKVVVFCRERT